MASQTSVMQMVNPSILAPYHILWSKQRGLKKIWIYLLKVHAYLVFQLRLHFLLKLNNKDFMQ